MTTDNLRLTVVSPRGVLFEDTASSVSMKAADGWFGVRAGALPVIAVLTECDIKYVKNEKEQTYRISGGFAEVKDNTVTVLVE